MIRILLVADTHLGLDLPFHPRVERRRRGPDFFANLELALRPALSGEVGLVVHGGDLLYRSRVPPALVGLALAPLLRVAEASVPVYLVPGNHERSRIPLHLWAAHPNLHIFDRPRTFTCRTAAGTVALAGFPFAREVRSRFRTLVEATGHRDVEANVRVLCMHQVVEGAQVGPGNYTFRSNPDVVRGGDIPAGFCAVLAGHIHRAQVLTRDLGGRRLAAPVVYPGSVERTAFAERDETKGFMVVDVSPVAPGGAGCARPQFRPLPARPMLVLDWAPTSNEPESVAEEAGLALRRLDPDAVVRLNVRGPHALAALECLSAGVLRSVTPPTMNVELGRPAAETRAPT